MKQLKQTILCLIGLILTCSQLYAQQVATIHGTVRDSLGNVLSSATVGAIGTSSGVYTDDKGRYSLSVPAGQKVKIVFTYLGLQSDSATVTLKQGEDRELNIRMKQGANNLPAAIIQEKRMRDLNVTKINPKAIGNLPSPSGNFEDILKTLPGVASNNELSSTYSVRGGNYDENLVYVNDVEIYRPFLVRAGQQEGLSFINSDMVDDIKFSAGGFDAVYGDKLSSVLDVKYREPKKFGAAVTASLLGASVEAEGLNSAKTLSFVGGYRYKSNSYLLKTLDTQGEYRPSFSDVQLLTKYKPKGKFEYELLGNYSNNIYTVIPTNRETDFGTLNDAKRLTVYFDGREVDSYETVMGAATITYNQNDHVKHKLIFSAFNTYEQEYFDILGQYYLDQLEADLGKEAFGNVAFNLGVGSFLNHARNTLDATVASVAYKGEVIGQKRLLQWGVKGQQEIIDDKLSEWNYIDSSRFSIPSGRDSANPLLLLNDVIKTKISLSSNRYSGYIQNTWQLRDDSDKVSITAGVRANYWDLNGQTVISPRASLSYKPRWSKRLNLRASWGYYYQPPFYRELRDLEGRINTSVKAQQSIHYVIGSDYLFLAFGREFKLTSEAYYKQLNALNPYTIDNLRIRYLADNNAKGYAAGIDFRLNGEFVPGVESWASMSFLKTEQDLSDDFYYLHYNASGDTIIPGYTIDQQAVDSTRIEPGYIPRPTDQRFTFSLFFQDYLPKFPTYKMHLSLIFGTGIPFGPPGPDLYKAILRFPPYRRVDIGFTKQIVGDNVTRPPHGTFFKAFESLAISLEVYNLLQVSNTVSHVWITDVTTARQYAVPNYLTSRQVNLKLQARF